MQDPAGQQFRRAEHYFLATALRRLMPGGLLAFVLPLSLLGDQHQAFRADLVRAGTVLLTALVPSGAFDAAGANLSTFVLIMKAHDQGVPAALATLPGALQARFHSERDTAFLAGTCCIENDKLAAGHLCAATAKVEFGQYGQPLVRGEPVLTQARLDTLLAEASPLRAFAVTAAKLEGALLTWTDDTVQPADEAEKVPGLASVYRQQALSAMRRADRHPLADGTSSPCGRFQYRRGQWHFATLLATPEAQTVLALARALQQQTLNREPHPDLPQLWADLRHWAGNDEEAQRQRITRLALRYPTVNLVLSPPALPAKRRLTVLPGSLGDVAAQLAATWQLTRPALTLHSGLPDDQVSTFLRAHYRFNGSVWVVPTEYDFGHAYEKAAQARETAQQWPHQSPEQLALLGQAEELEQRALAQARSIADTPLAPRDPLVPEEVLRDWVNTYLGTVFGGEPLLHVIKERGLTRLVMREGQAGDSYRVDQTLTRRLQDYLNYDTPTDRIEREGHSAESIEAQRARALKKAARYERSLELHFRSWLIHSPHAGQVEDLYNRTRNAFVLAPEDTSLLDLPLWRGPRHHLYQRGDIRTLAAWGHGLLAYEVGVGKTFTLLGLLSLLKQRGEAHRPWIVTPLSLTGNWVINIHKARPDWRVAVIGMNSTGTFDDEGLPEYTPDTTPQRKAKLAALLHQPPDVVVISMEAFTDIPLLDSTRLHLIENDAALLAQGAEQEDFSVKSGEFRGRKALVKEEDFLDHLMGRSRSATDTDLPFELFAPDVLVFEEAHKFKNLFEAPDYLGEKPKFMGAGLASKRAYDAYLKARWTRAQQGGRGTYSLTATPYKNSPLEVGYALALVTDALLSFGLHAPAAFMLQYCQIEPTLITRPDGGVGTRPAVTGFKNLRELRNLMRLHVIERDALTCRLDHRIGLPLPPLQRHIHTLDLTPEQLTAYGPERVAAANPQISGKDHLFSIFNRMQQYILHPEATCGGPNPRAEKAAELALDAERTGHKSIAFMDRGGDGGDSSAFAAYLRAYVQAGIPVDAIEVITSETHPDAVSRLKAEKRFRQGHKRHIIGSSVTREGLNLQHLTKHLIHLDLPHDPQDLNQRDGRGWRQGNPSEEIHSHLLLAKGSFDALQYQNVMGKKGWIDHLRSGNDSGRNPVAFQAEHTALLLAANPADVEVFIAAQAAAQQAELARQEHRSHWAAVQTFLDTATLLRTRHAKAQGRKHGPTAQDEHALARLSTDLRGAARTLAGLAPVFRQALSYGRPLTWIDDLPFGPGVTLTHGSAQYVVKAVTATHLTTQAGVNLDLDDLELATDVTLSPEERYYGAQPLDGLPPALRDDIEALLKAPPEEETGPLPESSDEVHTLTPLSTERNFTLFIGARRLSVVVAPTLAQVYAPTPGGLSPVEPHTPAEGVMLIGLSDTQVELIAAPGTAGALRDALMTQPLPVVERLTSLLNSAA